MLAERSLRFVWLAVLAAPLWADVNVKACAPEPAATDIAYGDLINCQIEQAADSDVFRFSGLAGETILIFLVRLEGSADHCFRIIEPDGAIGPNRCSGALRPVGVGFEGTLSKTGVYGIQVREAGGAGIYPYNLMLTRTYPSATNGLPISFGRVVTGAIEPAGDADFWLFNGNAGDTVNLTLTRLSGSSDHCFRLIEPDGAPTAYRCAGALRPRAVGLDHRLTKSGQFAIQVHEASLRGTYPYGLEIQCFGVCPQGTTPPPPPPTQCFYTLSPSSRVFPSAADSGMVGVSTPPGCAWSATSNGTGLTITSGATGAGPGTIRYDLSANQQPSSRTASITVSGQVATITQSGTAPLLVVSPMPMAFSFREGGIAPSDQVLNLFTNAPSLDYAVTTTGSWLSVSRNSGAAPGSIVVSVDATGLASGTYNGSININAPTANPSGQNVPVTLTVDAAGPPTLKVESEALTFSFAEGATARSIRRTVANSGGGSLTFQAEASADSRWLRVSPDQGQARLDQPASLVISADPSGLRAGTYTGYVRVSAGNEAAQVPVALTVSAVRQTILLSQGGLTFTAVAGGGSVPPQSFGILNLGQGVMDWQVSADTVSGGNWLSVTPARGTTDAGSLMVPLVDVSVNPANLAPGEYHGRVQVQAAAADNSPQYASVVLNVLPPGSDPGPLVRPTGLIFTGVTDGAAPDAQAVRIANLTGAAKPFISGTLTVDGTNWFTVTPATGNVTPAQQTVVQVQANPAGLTAGIRRGVLTLLFSDGAVRTVNVLYVLAAAGGGAGTNAVRTAEEFCVPKRLLPLVTSLGSGFAVSAGWPNALEARVVDDCGRPLPDGSVVATFSNGDPPLPLISLKDGRWVRDWTLRNAAQEALTLRLTAEEPGRRIEGRIEVTGGVRATVQRPVLASGGVLNGASFQLGAPVAPGSMISIFGQNLAQGQATSPRLPLENQLAGALVTIGGREAPLIVATEGQINAVVPYGLTPNTQQQVIVRKGDGYTAPEAVVVSAAQPAVFSADSTGRGQGIIVNPAGQIASAGQGAARGSPIVIYCTGLGEVDPPVAAGQAAPTDRLTRTVNPVSLKIGGVEAQVSFAGLVPGFTGFYQVNAVVPDTAPTGQVDVVLTVSGLSSPAVTMSVR
jgi:uncharacterized protein (TIGR03437 family)